MKQTVVSVRGQTVIPQEIRQKLGIKPNTKLSWSTQDGVIVVTPVPVDPVRASIGILKDSGYTFEDFLRDRRQERQLDRRREERLMKQRGNKRKGQRGG